MSKKVSLIIKIILFPTVFYILCLVAAFFFRNDANEYARVLMNELHHQEKIDVLFCGASHVSHGLLPSLMDEKLGVSTFCAGTPSQGIFETYAVIQDAASFYDIKEIFLELDFAIATSTPSNMKTRSSEDKFLAIRYLKNPKVKWSHIFQTTLPSYYLNELLPIGMNQLINLNPVTVYRNVKSKLNGDYWKFYFKEDTVSKKGKKTTDYQGKGCVFVDMAIKNGTNNSAGESLINVKGVNENFLETLKKIMQFCNEKNIKLSFYAHPCSDFYLCEKSNYDEYYFLFKEFLGGEGYDFYDFNLIKKEYLSLEDCDFYDSNHLNKSGITKFTNAFCDFYNTANKSKMFCGTYKERLSQQNEKILGLSLRESKDKKSLKIIPVLNHGDASKITYTVNVLNGERKQTLFENGSDSVVVYPVGSSGKIEIFAYYDGMEHCHILKNYVSM